MSHPSPPHRRRWLILALVSSALLLISIDGTVLYAALPLLTRDLQANANEKLWILNIYPLLVAGLLPGLGAAGDRLGSKRLFVSGLGVFALASLMSAFATRPQWLILGRAVLGVGAAMMMPATLSIIRQTFVDERERSLAIGVWASAAAGAAALGPILGGVVLEFYGWGAVFLINLPIILVVLPCALYFIPSQPVQKGKAWDVSGSLQIMVGLVGVVYAIKEFGRPQPDLFVAACAMAVGVSLLIVFVRRQQRAMHPLIDFRLFRDPVFSAGIAAAFCASLALLGLELVLTQYLQLVQDLTPLKAALVILPLPLTAFFAGPLTGWFLPTFGSTRVLTVALLMSGLSIGALMVSNMPSAFALMGLGAGVGAAMTAASSIIMHRAPATQVGMVASVEEVSFELGGALGVTLLGSLAGGIYSRFVALPEAAESFDQAVDSLDGALIVAAKVSPEIGLQLISAAKAAYQMAYGSVLGAAAALLLVSALSIYLLLRSPATAAATP
ncbi:MFS transporter [Pseudomonas purpurea]|uniref:MFS transporter n=1 Tax=Pseudomonas purpurea TaxID=3136737 RepID=UPI00326316C0